MNLFHQPCDGEYAMGRSVNGGSYLLPAWIAEKEMTNGKNAESNGHRYDPWRCIQYCIYIYNIYIYNIYIIYNVYIYISISSDH